MPQQTLKSQIKTILIPNIVTLIYNFHIFYTNGQTKLKKLNYVIKANKFGFFLDNEMITFPYQLFSTQNFRSEQLSFGYKQTAAFIGSLNLLVLIPPFPPLKWIDYSFGIFMHYHLSFLNL